MFFCEQRTNSPSEFVIDVNVTFVRIISRRSVNSNCNLDTDIRNRKKIVCYNIPYSKRDGERRGRPSGTPKKTSRFRKQRSQCRSYRHTPEIRSCRFSINITSEYLTAIKLCTPSGACVRYARPRRIIDSDVVGVSDCFATTFYRKVRIETNQTVTAQMPSRFPKTHPRISSVRRERRLFCLDAHRKILRPARRNCP